MAKARRRLSDLVHDETQKIRESNLQTSEVTKSESLSENPSETEERVTEQQTNKVTDLQTSVTTKPVTPPESSSETEERVTEQQTNKITDLQSLELPKYLKLERKEARLRQDQIDALTDLTRKLNRTKRVKGGERLTDNTLIRVAVDLLLSKASELQGTTEDELRNSLNL
jgi:hypothetical protein